MWVNKRWMVVTILCATFLLNIADAYAGCISGDCFNGYGTFVYKDHSKYTGSFLYGRPHGKGTYYQADGSVYTGPFENGVKHGLGKMVFTSGDIYTGHFFNGMVQGRGRMAYSNGDVYLGDWIEGRASGEGKYQFANGDVYEGEIVDGYISGYGRMTLSNGDYYEGGWVNNKKHGKGIEVSQGVMTEVYYQMDQLASQHAIAEEDELNNDAEADAEEYPQALADCNSIYCDHTKGTFRYQDGSVYTGDFIKGQGEGEGQCVYANGDIYTGQWKNHAPHGKGTMVFANGITYKAIWNDGVPLEKIEDKVIAQNNQQTNKQPEAKDKISKTQSSTKPKIYALIVGIASYLHMPSLKYTDDDAYRLYAFLKSPEGGALPDNQVEVLIDDAATRQTIVDGVRKMVRNADENDVIMLYMAGHGLDGSFVPSDFDGYKNQLAYAQIMDMLDGASAKHKLFIVDACYSGSMLAQARSPYSVALENFYSAYNTTQGGTAVMMSSKKEETSLEYTGIRQGIFSHFLIKGLKGEADSDSNKLITVSELYDFVSSSVRDYTAKAQNPLIMGDYDKNMPVAWVSENP